MKQLQLTEIIRPTKPLASIDVALQHILNPTAEQTGLQKARQTMGTALTDTSDEDLEIYMTEFQHLIDYWLDAYEREAFGGMTLRQVLGQG